MPELISRGDGKGRRRGGYTPMAQINVTPFVDVMLVLLIVFMVTAPLLTVGVPVNLPRAQAPNISEPEEPLVVTVIADGRVYVQESEVALPNLVPLLVEVTGANPEVRIFVRGDRELVYGRIMEVMGAIAGAGFSRVSLVAEMPPDRASAQ
jgi:biopolymer transport protein TolR